MRSMYNKYKIHKKEKKNSSLNKIELWFTPILIIVPMVISLFFLQDWYFRGFLFNNSTYDNELLIGLVILIGNIIFDIPYLKSIKYKTPKTL